MFDSICWPYLTHYHLQTFTAAHILNFSPSLIQSIRGLGCTHILLIFFICIVLIKMTSSHICRTKSKTSERRTSEAPKLWESDSDSEGLAPEPEETWYDGANDCGGECLSCRSWNAGRRVHGYHRHLSFEDVECSLSGRYDLQIFSLDCDGLATGIINILEGPLKLIQHKGLEKWRDRSKCVPILRTTDTTDLEFYFDLFDDYLFAGAMKAHRRIEWVDRHRPGGRYWLGATTVSDGPKPHALIRILRPRDLAYKSVLIPILSTLVHEMLHAFFRLFIVRCCCSADTMGVTGHGPSMAETRTGCGRGIEPELQRVG